MCYNQTIKKQKKGQKMEYQTNRKEKGNSLLKWAEDYVLVDIETTGLSPERDDIIEIGAIKVKQNQIIDQYESLIKIQRRLNPFITRLTGITNEMLLEGREITEVLQEFIEFTGDHIIIGHNVNFDINFIYNKCQKYMNYPIKNDFIDTMRIARRVLPSSPNYKLETLAKHFQIDYGHAHRGLRDVEITYQVYNELRQLSRKKVVGDVE